ncbi:ferredoxin-type protein NapF [Chelativorans alearense]|uniref:ferredoxin-type protein NapF n=1 Tax=Chelativorans alearense TaxID=2681495 RepID=UPI0013D39AA5|nr:ferredoxin-type protein NapF [Chelativorans alearense]
MGGQALSRRAFLRGGRGEKWAAIRPPGLAPKRVGDCTACGACAEACPTGIISLCEGTPAIDFSAGECTFCGACAEACPEALFGDALAAFDHVIRIAGTCLARSGISCMACRDLCPEDAIRLRPRIGGPFLPEIDEETCTGCGACIAGCPAQAIAAVLHPEVAHG